MNRRIVNLLPVFGLLAATPLVGQSCQLCSTPEQKVATSEMRRPLRIAVDSVLDFSSLALVSNQGGSAEVDSRSGVRRVTGGVLALGGGVLRGSVHVTGEPFARVTVRLPLTLELRSSSGTTAFVNRIETDLSPDPTLDAAGTLRFSFGGRISVNDGAAGDFQGRFPVFVDYQ
jgi:Domain of unknown function (DUF4402)